MLTTEYSKRQNNPFIFQTVSPQRISIQIYKFVMRKKRKPWNTIHKTEKIQWTYFWEIWSKESRITLYPLMSLSGRKGFVFIFPRFYRLSAIYFQCLTSVKNSCEDCLPQLVTSVPQLCQTSVMWSLLDCWCFHFYSASSLQSMEIYIYTSLPGHVIL